ncbi:MAG: ATPase [Boseongicola sp.]|nr:MAG: ATPase [Boseongicola sp.]
MSGWANKRFWKSANSSQVPGGWAVLLDGRAVKTPAKRQLIVPTRELADPIALEWDSQIDVVDPAMMPWTRSANAAIDKVAEQRSEVEGHLIEYAETDLLIYRADNPDGLVARQADRWDPVLDWVASRYDVRLLPATGVMPVAQDGDALRRLAGVMSPMTHFELTGFYDLVTLSGSFSIALAVSEGVRTADEGWALSRLDEEWQIEQCGRDELAEDEAELKRSAFCHAATFFSAANPIS